jgi:hypothetical protein
MISSEECRAYAEECRLLAQSASPEHKKILLDLAQHWDRACEEISRLENFKPPVEIG